MYRERTICNDDECTELNEVARQTRTCALYACPQWSTWLDWQEKGPSEFTRERVCNNDNYLNLTCHGERDETIDCRTHSCGSWTDWGTWFLVAPVGQNNDERSIFDDEAFEFIAATTIGPLVIEDFLNAVSESSGDEQSESSLQSQTIFNPLIFDGDIILPSSTPSTHQTRTYERSRKCVNGKITWPNCFGNATESYICDEDCPYFTEWTEWTFNPVSRVLVRNRECKNDEIIACVGAVDESIDCNQSCPHWDEWTSWSDLQCDEQCRRTRSRLCVSVSAEREVYDISDCIGGEQNSTESELHPCNCSQKWSEWSKWTVHQLHDDSHLDHDKFISRRRRCKHSSKECDFDDVQKKTCLIEGCPTWSLWGPWVGSNATHLARERTCLHVIDDMVNVCPGSAYEEKLRPTTVSTSTTTSPTTSTTTTFPSTTPTTTTTTSTTTEILTTTEIQETWAEWGTWTVTNNYNWLFARSRPCEIEDCEVVDTQIRDCKVEKCAYFTEWVQLYRNETNVVFTRNCINENELLGEYCIGETVKEEVIGNGVRQQRKLPSMLTGGNWGEWDVKLPCSTTCGVGKRFLVRTCESNTCDGDSLRIEDCYTNVDCPEWRLWSEWGDCTASCEDATRVRSRSCSGPGTCVGLSTESEECDNIPCPIWSEWLSPIDCSKSCGGGIALRFRDCNFGSTEQCGTGDYVEKIDCNMSPCPIWSSWSRYGECSKTCGAGTHYRARHCLYGAPDKCEGSNKQTKTCNVKLCPYFDNWSAWSTCSVSCLVGSKTRTRNCRNGRLGDKGCIGKVIQEGICDGGECPIWSPWAEWTPCSETCGSGIQDRSRQCQNSNYLGEGCDGLPSERQNCNTEPCPFFTNWKVSKCSSSCGGGKIAQSRSCVHYVPFVHECDGATIELLDCNIHTCPHWAEWSPFQSCSKTCDSGEKRRTRTCLDGLIGQNGCENDYEEVEPCNSQHCPFWLNWSQWTGCSRTCSQGENSGHQTRNRPCMFGNQGDIGCEGPIDEDRLCNTGICPHWTPWKAQSSCSVTCGDGFQSKFRNCINGEPDVTPECQGKSVIVAECNDRPCPHWSEWKDAVPCSRSCGAGIKQLSRTCVDGVVGEDEQCNGETETFSDCNTQPCPLWSEWSNWRECSTTCNSGTSYRDRKCINGKSGDDSCPGEVTETRVCNAAICKMWSEWTEYTECSVSCSNGSKKRTRTCDGDVGECKGISQENHDCFAGTCPTWSEWEDWSTCTKTCAGGSHVRSRECLNGSPDDDGCIGPTSDSDVCNEVECPAWVPWSEWTECSTSCGGGIREIRRKCKNGFIGQEGCVGNQRRLEPCSENACIEWTEWYNWGSCDKVCGDGKATRYRDCMNARQGLPGCTGDRTEIRECDLPFCDTLTAWSSWSQCSLECRMGSNIGERARSRSCESLTRENPADRLCDGELSDNQNCNNFPCLNDANNIAQCEPITESVNCGKQKGFIETTRDCTPEELAEGECTEGFIIQSKLCDLVACERTRNRERETTTQRIVLDQNFEENLRNSLRNTGDNRPRLKSSFVNVCPKSDIVVMLDSSSSMGVEKMKMSRKFTEQLIRNFRIGLNKTRLALLTFDSKPHLKWDLRDSINNDEMKRSLTELKYDNGVGTNTGAALNFVADHVLLHGYGGDRYDVPDVVIILTDGKSQDDPVECAVRLKARYVKIIVIGIGESAYEPQLNQMASSPTEQNVFQFSKYKQLHNSMAEITGAIKQACYKAAGWSEWSNWESCSVTCGTGQTERKRRCHHAEMGSRSCPGKWNDQQSCELDECESAGNGESSAGSGSGSEWSAWGDWGAWSAWAVKSLQCSAQCGGGTFIGAQINNTKINQCNTHACPSWTNWNTWSTCSQSCGRGTQYRQRACHNHMNNTSDACDGTKEDLKECIIGGCPFWSQWALWSPCDGTCGTNVKRTRDRRCINIKNGNCDGLDAGVEKCEVPLCPIWSRWTSWSDCSKECGYGSISRERKCINGNPRSDCPGISLEDKICKLDDCAIWSNWSSLGGCSVTCGAGESTRTRTCSPGYGTCTGEDTKMAACRMPRACDATTVQPETTVSFIETIPTDLISAELLENPIKLKLASRQPTNSTSCTLSNPLLSATCLNDHCTLNCSIGHKLIGLSTLSCVYSPTEDTHIWNDTVPMCAPQCTEKTDVIFVVDEISSERQSTYVRQFIKKFLSLFVINDSQAQFAALEIVGDTTALVWGFEEAPSKATTMILSDRFIGGRNNEIQLLPDVLTSGRSGVPKSVIHIKNDMTSLLESVVTIPFQMVDIIKETIIRPELVVDMSSNFESGDLSDEIPVTLLEDLNIQLKLASGHAEPEQFEGHLESIVNNAVDQVKFCNILEPQPCVEESKMDLAFMIDSSSSIGEDNFEKVKTFVKEIVNRFQIGPDQTRIAILRYNNDVTPVLWFDTFNTKSEIVAAIDAIGYSGSGTETGKALEYTANYVLNPMYGARAGVPSITLVITDGESTDDLTESSQLLRARSNVIAIGISKDANPAQLAQMASSPLSLGIHALSDFADLLAVSDSLMDSLCTLRYISELKHFHS